MAITIPDRKPKLNHTPRLVTHGEGKSTPMARLIPAELAVRRIAESAGLARGFDSKRFDLQISESRTAYFAFFVPKARIRGDGLRVDIDKRDLKIKQVVYLQ